MYKKKSVQVALLLSSQLWLIPAKQTTGDVAVLQSSSNYAAGQ